MLETISHINIKIEENRADDLKMQEILTKIVSEISQLLQFAQKLVIISSSASQILITDNLQHFKQKLANSLLSFCLKNQDKFKFQKNQSKNFNILKRFCCRIMEFIVPFKQKSESSQTLKPLVQLIKRIQAMISSLQQKNNFIEFVGEVKNIFHHFCMYLNKKRYKQSQEKKSLKTQEQKSNVQIQAFINKKDTRYKNIPVEHEYQKKLKRILNSLNSRFKTLDCMDLDYNYFKTSFFQAKGQTQFFQSFMQRNSLIQNQIKNYERKYREYQNRKNRRIPQKTIQFGDTKLSLNKTYIKDISSFICQKNNSISVGRNISLRSNNSNIQLQQDGKGGVKKFSLADQGKNTFGGSQLKQKQKNKLKYEMKSILLTASKIKVQPYISIQRVSLKNTLRQLEASKKKSNKNQQRSFLRNLKQITDRFSPSKER